MPEIEEPNKVAVASADAQGAPSVRMVLLKAYDERGFVFYSNYGSRKARELANGRASLCFYWEPLQHQVRGLSRRCLRPALLCAGHVTSSCTRSAECRVEAGWRGSRLGWVHECLQALASGLSRLCVSWLQQCWAAKVTQRSCYVDPAQPARMPAAHRVRP